MTLSGLRGRGGGGFRTGRKWLSILEASRDDERRFVVGNGAEGEPGTFKDRAILRHNPYQVIEGLAIAALTVRATHAYLAVKASFTREVEILRRALVEMRAVGLAGDIPIPHILTNGPEWYRALGTWDSPGTMVFTVVGDVVRPGYAELELGTTIRNVIEQVGGGTHPGRSVKAVFSGVSNGVITPTTSTYRPPTRTSPRSAAGWARRGSSSTTTRPTWWRSPACSPGSCTSSHADNVVPASSTAAPSATRSNDWRGRRRRPRHRRARRRAADGDRPEPLLPPVELQTVVASILRELPEDFVTHLERTAAPPRPYRLPKIVDMSNGTVTYDPEPPPSNQTRQASRYDAPDDGRNRAMTSKACTAGAPAQAIP